MPSRRHLFFSGRKSESQLESWIVVQDKRGQYLHGHVEKLRAHRPFGITTDIKQNYSPPTSHKEVLILRVICVKRHEKIWIQDTIMMHTYLIVRV